MCKNYYVTDEEARVQQKSVGTLMNEWNKTHVKILTRKYIHNLSLFYVEYYS
jgi:hypothetical protein